MRRSAKERSVNEGFIYGKLPKITKNLGMSGRRGFQIEENVRKEACVVLSLISGDRG